VNAQTLTRTTRHKLLVLKSLLDTGMFEPARPDRLVHSLSALRRWGATSAGAYTGAAARYPDRAALIDERGWLTFKQLHLRTNALARELCKAGISEGDGVAIMCRNHRGFIEATVACSKLGAGALYLNTAFAGPQITDVLKRENPVAVVYDEEFSGLVGEGAADRIRFIAWS
jgi:acyl-CoA synthetase (AMP-forming)/AMP-acid ligase II